MGRVVWAGLGVGSVRTSPGPDCKSLPMSIRCSNRYCEAGVRGTAGQIITSAVWASAWSPSRLPSPTWQARGALDLDVENARREVGLLEEQVVLARQNLVRARCIVFPPAFNTFPHKIRFSPDPPCFSPVSVDTALIKILTYPSTLGGIP